MDSKRKGKKANRKNEKEKKVESDKIEVTEVIPSHESQTVEGNADAGDSASSTDSEELVNALNYNTITSLAALKDIIQGDNNDTPETDSFFQHYFMNHCNNLSSRNSASPFPFTERRRLSQCREEDEDDEKKDGHRRHSPGSYKADSEKINSDLDDNLKESEDQNLKIDSKELNTESNTEIDKPNATESNDTSERTVMGAKHKFLVTKTAQMTAPVARALRNQFNNAHTVHFGTKGAEEQRPNVRTIFTGQNLHHDKNYFDSSLIEIRSTVDGVPTSDEDIWIKRTDEKQLTKQDSTKKIADKIVKKVAKETLEDKKVVARRERSGTWGSLPARKEKEKETPKKSSTEKEVRRSSDDRRQKREQRLDAAITRSWQSVGERKRRGSADDGQGHLMYQQTIHGTSGVSRRPALFDIFKSRSRGEAKKQSSIMQQVKAAVQNITKSLPPTRESTKSESDNGEVATSSSVGSLAPTTKDGSAHVVADTVFQSQSAREPEKEDGAAHYRYYHTVSATTSRRPSAMAKVMDIFRGRSSIPGQMASPESPDRRRTKAQAQHQHHTPSAHLRRAASQEAEKRRSSLGNVPTARHRASDAFLDPHHAAMLFRDSRGLPVADPFLEKVSLSDLGKCLLLFYFVYCILCGSF